MKSTALLILTCCFVIGVIDSGDQPADESSQRIEECLDGDTEPTNVSTFDCVILANNTYSNVTKLWTSRINEEWAWLAIAIPALYGAIMLVAILIANRKEVGFDEIKLSYQGNKLQIYFKDYCGEELYSLITSPPPPEHPHYDLFNKPDTYGYIVAWQRDGLYVKGYEGEGVWTDPVRVCAAQPGKKFSSVFVTADVLKKAGKPFLHCIQLPKQLKFTAMVVTIFLLPVIKTAWDIIDIAADGYYFVQLESGTLLSSVITRNVYINNVVLAFAILGAIKSTLLGWGYSHVVYHSDVGGIAPILMKPALVCVKIIMEDAVELVAEYFFVDRYVTAIQPWWLVFKDVVTAALYLAPLVTIIKDFKKDCRTLRRHMYFTVLKTQIHVYRWVHVYILCVIVHFTFSVATIVRVLGMIYQYTDKTISRECLAVHEGRLTQTPFAAECINGFDVVILCCMSIILLLFILIVFFVILHQFNDSVCHYLFTKFGHTRDYIVNSAAYKCFCNVVKVIKGIIILILLSSTTAPLYNTCIGKWMVKQFGYFKSSVKFDIDGKTTGRSRTARKDTLEHVSFWRLKKHFTPDDVEESDQASNLTEEDMCLIYEIGGFLEEHKATPRALPPSLYIKIQGIGITYLNQLTGTDASEDGDTTHHTADSDVGDDELEKVVEIVAFLENHQKGAPAHLLPFYELLVQGIVDYYLPQEAVDVSEDGGLAFIGYIKSVYNKIRDFIIYVVVSNMCALTNMCRRMYNMFRYFRSSFRFDIDGQMYAPLDDISDMIEYDSTMV